MKRLALFLVILALGCAAAPVLAATYTIAVQTDKPTYTGVVHINVSGTVSPAPGPNTAVIVVISNPVGAAVDIQDDAVDATTGNFNQTTVAGGGMSCGGSLCWVSGTYQVNATWAGDNASAKMITTFNYQAQSATTVTVACAPSSFAVGTSSQCTATLSGAGGTTDGELIAFSQTGGTGHVSFPSPATCALSGNSCALSVKGNSTGTATIQAMYGGDSSNSGSTSTTSVTMTKAATSIQLQCLVATGRPFPCAVTLTGWGASVVGENVTFSVTGDLGVLTLPNPAACILTVAGGSATCQLTVNGTKPGTITLQAVYAGDVNNAGSSGDTTVTVFAATTTSSTSSTSSTSTGATSSSSSTVTRTTSSIPSAAASNSALYLILAAVVVILVLIGLVVMRRRSAGGTTQSQLNPGPNSQTP